MNGGLVFTDAETIIEDFGGAPICTHNRGCDVCRERKAVRAMSNGIFLPCWECQGAQRDAAQTARRAWMPQWLKALLR